MSYKIIECNVDKCLRKYKNSETGEISKWCGVTTKDEDVVAPNTKNCPLYCDKFFCYKTEKIIKGHDEKYWISDDEMNDDYRKTYNIKARDVKFSGLSKTGNEIQYNELRYLNQETIVCPYCDYKIEDVWDYIDSSYSDYENVECPECEKEFEVSIHREITFSTNKID